MHQKVRTSASEKAPLPIKCPNWKPPLTADVFYGQPLMVSLQIANENYLVSPLQVWTMSVYILVVVAEPDKRLQNRTVLCWSGMTDTEHECLYAKRRTLIGYFELKLIILSISG